MKINRLARRASRQFRDLKSYGPSSIFDDFLNGQKAWSLAGSKKPTLLADGSISGTDPGYLGIVQESIVSEDTFLRFKANREYREILEHVDRELGRKYLRSIRAYGDAQIEFYTFLKSNFCNPFRYSYKGLGRVSPSNLRYGKIALDIKVLFGNLEEFRISEIGIGYGGQCHALTSVSNFKTYTFYDLPDVVELARLYLNRFCPNIKNYSGANFQLSNSDVDLVISNYAFSELDRTLQEIYLENVILKSKRGYMIYNDITYNRFDTIKVKELVERIPGAEIVSEHPLSHVNNKLVIWGHANLSQLVLSE